MAKPIKARINVTKILKQHLYDGKSGKYLNLVIWPNKKPSEYGDTHTVQQEISREARDAGEKEPYIGNLTMPEQDEPRRPAQQSRQPAQRPRPPVDPDLDVPPDDIPF